MVFVRSPCGLFPMGPEGIRPGHLGGINAALREIMASG